MLNSRKEVAITTMRKNIIKITAIALLSAFALTACDDDIIAKPTGYDDNSPVVDIDKTVYNNDFQSIYDAIRSGNLASDVLDELLYQYSVSVFGNYNKITESKMTSDQTAGITLKAAAKSVDNGTKTDANEFIKNHSAYWTKNADGKRADDTGHARENPETADATESEYARLTEKWNTIEKRIAEKLYSSISGGAYSERNIFKEERFLNSLGSSVENKVKPLGTTGIELFEGLITPDVEDYEVFEKEVKDINNNNSKILHRENYQSKGGYDFNTDEAADEKVTYVEDKIIPDIYRQLLVEQYILDESYDTLGRTSAREISVLSISKNSNYAKGAADIMNKFVKDYIFNPARTDEITLDTFKMVSRAWVGAFMDDATPATTYPEESALLAAAIPDYLQSYDDGNGHTYNYYQGTAYGDMVEEIKKINENPALSENESTYTGGNAYPIETGKEIKVRELELKDYTSTGWYVKSVGVSALPDAIKNQLFDINVANALSGKKGEECVEYSVKNGVFTDEQPEGITDPINVVGKIKLAGVEDQYFLRNTSRVKDIPFQNDLLFESDGTYYVVLIHNATRSSDLNKKNYGGTDAEGNPQPGYDVLENYINEIVQIVADNDTYKTLSKKHWVEKMDLKYHDQVIYDYFKSNFPELFDDDDSSEE